MHIAATSARTSTRASATTPITSPAMQPGAAPAHATGAPPGAATAHSAGAASPGLERIDQILATGVAARDGGDSAGVLVAGADFLRDAGRAVEHLGREVERRAARIDELRASGAAPEHVAHEQQQMTFADRLRQMIAESQQRIAQMLLRAGDHQGVPARETPGQAGGHGQGHGRELDIDVARGAAATQLQPTQQALAAWAPPAWNAGAAIGAGAVAATYGRPAGEPGMRL